MRRLKEIYPAYADRVGVLAVSYDPSATPEEVVAELGAADWQWPAGQAVGTMTRDYRIIISSIKVAFDSRGVIIYRGGFGEGSDDDWRQVFQNLAASR